MTGGEKTEIELYLQSRKEIDEIKTRFEKTWREFAVFQSDMKHSVSIINQKQDNLKERFEAGTATTLRELRKDFSDFLKGWGIKQEQDKIRDESIEELKKKNETIERNFNWLFYAPLITVCFGILTTVILYAFKHL